MLATGCTTLYDGAEDYSTLPVFGIYNRYSIIGTAFYVIHDGKKLFLTAAHVLETNDVSSLYLEKDGNKYRILGYAKPDKSHDLAVLQVEQADSIRYKNIILEMEKARKYSEVISINYSTIKGMDAGSALFSHGNLLYTSGDHGYYSLNVITKGASGAPVFFKGNSRKVIGIITDRMMDTSNGTYIGVSNGITSEVIGRILDEFLRTFPKPIPITAHSNGKELPLLAGNE